MHIPQTLKTYLDHEQMEYDVLPHSEVFRAVAVAQTLHTTEQEIARL
jgi:hypothetical protein